jgi:hypothetical protein
MKIRISVKGKRLASSLLVALVTCSILSVSIFGYLSMSEQQHYLSARSQAWNMAIAVVEAGIEEGLEQMNTNPTSLASDGWTYANSVYSRTRTLPDGNSYTVKIDMTLTPPAITSQATVSPPTLAQKGSSFPFLAAQGINFTPQVVNRAVRVRASKNSMFTKAMVAKLTIDMNGNNIMTDSFDSSDPAYSNGGLYPAGITSKLKDNGDVASNDTIINSVNAGNANIYGHVSTGPGGTVSVGSNGAIGPHAWQAAGNLGIAPNWVTADSNFTFPDTGLAYNSGLSVPGPGDVTTVTFPVTTNTVTSSTYPIPMPMGGITSSNFAGNVTVTVLPNPMPAGTLYSTQSVFKGVYPLPGYYVPGTLTQHGQDWDYMAITGWTYPTYTYTYHTYYTNTVYTTNHYDHVLATGDYYTTGSLDGTTYVAGDARIVLPNGLNMGGSDMITVGPGASFKMYCDGNSCKVSGNGVVNNSGYAANFILYCTTNVTDVTFDGNGEFTGVLVAPSANVKMNGGGHSDNDFIGALIVNSVQMNGHYMFHYDEALGKNRKDGRLLISGWDEVRPSF